MRSDATIAAMLDWLRRYRVALGVVLLAIALVIVGTLLWRPPSAPVAVVVPTFVPSPAAQIMVHVVGEVRAPGLYQLPGGSRVVDAIERAGGLSESADSHALNMAARLSDGQRIAVPQLGAAAQQSLPGRLNINRATRAELEALPGIGAVTAQRIVEHRDRNGPFQSLDQIREQRVLTVSVIDRIRDLVVVE